MVDLSKKPFYLNEKEIKWVEKTISEMPLEDKIGQLFVDHSNGDFEENIIEKRTARTKAGGLRYMNLKKEDQRLHNSLYQKHSKYPILIAANTEAGGNGAIKGGTRVGEEIKIAATNEPSYAYKMGLVGAREAKAVGCNMSFTPIVDITYNFRNPAIATRTWSDDPETVLKFSREMLRGLHDGGLLATAKHFPGDGVDERDHHFAFSVNDLSVKKWDETYGKIYQAMIDDGVEAVMAGHIMLPEYQKALDPNCKDEDLLPASLSKSLLTDLLRGKMGFNGLIVTDASHMVGYSGRMPRRKGIVTSINAGCDMILFYNDIEEDQMYMKEAIDSGELSMDRVNDALRRIFGLKAKAGLMNGFKEEDLPSLDVVGCIEHLEIAKEVADKGITLAKYKADFLPMDNKKHKRVMIVPVPTQQAGFAKMVAEMMGSSGIKGVGQKLIDKLNARGFEASFFKSPLTSDDPDISPYEYKSSIEKFKSEYDFVITIAEKPAMDVVQRLSWDTPKGGFEVPWYVYDLPIVFVSFACPFHLCDVPQVKCYINAYDSSDITLDALVDKLTGVSEFKGISPVDVYCGKIDTRL